MTSRSRPYDIQSYDEMMVDDLGSDKSSKILSDILQSQPPFCNEALDQVVCTRAHDFEVVAADKTLSSDPFNGRPSALAGLGLRPEDRGSMALSQADGAVHRRLRRLITEAFSARAIDSMRSQVEAIATSLLDGLDTNQPFELAVDFASPLPILVIAAMLGIDDADVDAFRVWTDDLLLMLKPDRSSDELQRMIAAVSGLDGVTAKEIEKRRASPRDDLIGTLVTAGGDEDHLTDAEIVNNTRLLLSAGYVTTKDLITNGVVTLLERRSVLAQLVADPSLWPSAIDELLRFEAPINFIMRTALEDREIGGCPVEAGQAVIAVISSANRDPDVHPDPGRFDIHRKQRRHFAFGGGVHFCLGASLARMEGEVALRALFERFPDLELVPGRPPERRAHPYFNGYESVWVKPS